MISDPEFLIQKLLLHPEILEQQGNSYLGVVPWSCRNSAPGAPRTNATRTEGTVFCIWDPRNTGSHLCLKNPESAKAGPRCGVDCRVRKFCALSS